MIKCHWCKYFCRLRRGQCWSNSQWRQVLLTNVHDQEWNIQHIWGGNEKCWSETHFFTNFLKNVEKKVSQCYYTKGKWSLQLLTFWKMMACYSVAVTLMHLFSCYLLRSSSAFFSGKQIHKMWRLCCFKVVSSRDHWQRKKNVLRIQTKAS